MIYKFMMESGHSSIDAINDNVQQQCPEVTVSTIALVHRLS